MKNKFRRSMTSVLLAASLLFSSQSVVAFADYGSKSDASDLSPVQESVENATEEQQEDPSLSVEPVIGESTEAPVAAPMMARANAPVAYSAPSVDTERYEWLDMSFTSNCNSYSIDLYTTKNAGTIHEENQNVGGDFDFTEGIGFRTYKAVPNNPNEWVFDSWKTNVYFDGWGFYEPIEDDNIQGPANKWAFSMRGYDTSKYDGSDADVQLNAILPTAGIVIGHPLYYTLCANFNPLVTVTTDGNGTVSPAPNEELVEHDGKYEVAYGKNATFTITPKDGFKVKTVTANDTLITANPDGTYTLESVTEPTTLKVEFEETEDVITADNIDGDVIINVLCPNPHSYSFNMSKGTAGQQGDYYIMSSNPSKAKVSINSKAWVKKFNELTGMVPHELTGDGYITFELTRDGPNEKWKLPDEAKQYKVIIDVKCTSEIPEPDKSIISQLEVALNCVNVTDGSHNYTSKLSTLTTGYYTCTVDQEKQTATVKIDDTQAKYWIDKNINTMVGKEQHSFVSVSDPITLTYENGQWKVPADSKFTINMLCAPTDKEIETALNGKVNVICDTQPQKHAAKSYGVDFDGAYTRPEVMKENTYVVTINHNVYPAKYDSDFLTYPAPKHTLIEGNPTESLATFVWNSSENKWELQEDKDTLAEIHVQCEIPSLDADDLAPLKVYLECVGNPDHNDGPIGNLGYLDPTTYYTVTVNTETKTATVEIKPTQSENWVNNSNVVGKPQHILYMPSNEKVTFTYTNGKWKMEIR